MIRSLSFKSDPPSPFHTYDYHRKKAIKEGYIDTQPNPDIKSEIIRQVLRGLTELFEIPEDYHLVLLQEDRLMIEMLTNAKTGQLSRLDVSGKDLGKLPLIIQDIDLMTGQRFHLGNLKESLDINTSSFIHVDISLSSPSDPLDYENFQSFSFKTRYGFGMNEDLIVWILREDLLEKLSEKYSGRFMEFDPGLTKSKKCIVQNELQAGAIYIFAMIVQDFLNRGLTIIRNEIKYKSIILQNSISDNPDLDPLVKDPFLQSQNIICAKTEIPREKIFDFMSENRIEFDVLDSSSTTSLIRIANYPVHSKEQMEFLVDLMEKL